MWRCLHKSTPLRFPSTSIQTTATSAAAPSATNSSRPKLRLQRSRNGHRLSMASAERLEHLRKLTLNDIKALPDRPAQVEPEISASDEEDGGISLLPPADPPPANHQNKQTASSLFPAPSVEPEPAQVPPTASCDGTERRFIWRQGQSSSYNLGSASELSASTTARLPPATLHKGDLVSAHDQFTPIAALSKYPYSFVNRSLSQDLATAFWDQGSQIASPSSSLNVNRTDR